MPNPANLDYAGRINQAVDYVLEWRALHWLFFAWLRTSGYAPAHQPMFEADATVPL